MSDHSVSRFGHVELEDMPEDLRQRIGAIAEKSGFVPNVFKALARRPAELRAFIDYHDALMESSEGLSKAERELVVVATSGANSCTYCVVAHGAILRIIEKKPLLADQLAVNYLKADITERQSAMLDFAITVCEDSASLVDDDYELLREYGFTDDDIWDIGAIAAFFALSNRIANVASMRPNDEFYSMGRAPRLSVAK
jgi:uncharacterized peroxidase-related enzyme